MSSFSLFLRRRFLL